MGPIRHLLSTSLPRRKWQIAGLLLLGAVAGLSEGAGLILLNTLLNQSGGGAARTGLGNWTISLEAALTVYVVAVVVIALVTYLRVIVAARLRFGAVAALRRRIVQALLHMEWPALQRFSTPHVNQLLGIEVNRLGSGIEFLLNASAISARIPILLAVTLAMSPYYALTVLAVFCLFLAVTIVVDRLIRRSGERFLIASGALQAAISEMMAGRRVIKGMNLEEPHLAHFDAVARGMRQIQMEQASRVAGGHAVATISVAVMVVVGLVVAVNGFNSNLAEALVATLAFVRLGQTGMRIQEAWRAVVMALPAEAAIRRMLEDAQMQAEPGFASKPFQVPRDFIGLQGVAVARDDGRALLKLPDIRIPVGKVTVVAGPSGSGKTTLTDVVMGLHVPMSGQILLDGRALDMAERRAWRDRIGYLPQDVFLFNDSIRNNLLQVAPEAAEQTLWQALEKADVAGVVRQLPQQLDTIVGERGDSLSGGERQRVGLARALLRGPDLLILDEPTSALDADSETRILRVLQQLKGDLTILVVTHRPAFLALADHVITLDEVQPDHPD